MKKNVNKNGFTLVELLVTIVILGIITGIALPLIRNIQSKNDDRKYSLYAESLLASAKLYNDSYSEDMFGHKEVGCAYITYNQMKNRDLLKDIELHDITCNSKSTYVRVIKVKDKYGYSSFLGCGSKSKSGAGGLEKKDITISYPDKGTVNEMDTGYCTGVKDNNLSVKANPNHKGTTYDKKNRKTVIKVESSTGINNQIDIRKSWYLGDNSGNKIEGTETGFEKIDFKIPGSQEEKLLNGESISTSSLDLVTPDDFNGDAYLEVMVNQLSNLYGENWFYDETSTNCVKRNSDTGSLIFGPFKVDNTPPVIDSLVVSSRENGYSSTKAKVTVRAHDNLTNTNDLLLCIKEGDSCSKNDYKSFKEVTDIDLSGVHDGLKRDIIIKIKDAAGNVVTRKPDYVVASTIIYKANGGSGRMTNTYCDNNTDCTLKANNFVRTGYHFAGWYSESTNGTKYGDVVKLNGEIRNVYAHWTINRVIIRLNMNGGSLANPHGSMVTNNGDAIVYNNSEDVHIINYGKKLTTDGLLNYNNTAYLNVEKQWHEITNKKEWNSKADGTGTEYDQAKVYKAEDFCDASENDCVVTLYLKWIRSKYTLTLSYDSNISHVNIDNAQSTESPFSKTISAGAIIPYISATPKKYNHFTTWNDGNTSAVRNNILIDKNKSLTAYGDPNHIILRYFKGDADTAVEHHGYANDPNVCNQSAADTPFGTYVDKINAYNSSTLNKNGLPDYDSTSKCSSFYFEKNGYKAGKVWIYDSTKQNQCGGTTVYTGSRTKELSNTKNYASRIDLLNDLPSTDKTNLLSKLEQGDITICLYPKYTLDAATSYGISYDLDGGSVSPANPTSYTVNDSFTLNNPTKSGYDFTGWTGSNGSTPQKTVSILKGTYGDKNYKANWKTSSPSNVVHKVKIKYHANGATLTNGSGKNYSIKDGYVANNENIVVAKFDYGDLIASSGLTDYNYSPNFVLSKTGYVIDEAEAWNTNANGTGTSYSQKTVYNSNVFCNASSDDCEVTLYANWKIKTLTISYNGNGHTGGSVSPTTCYYDVSCDLAPNTFTKTGYDLFTYSPSKWYNSDDSRVFSPVRVKGNHTYYARWTPKKLTITYNCNGGSGGGTEDFVYDEPTLRITKTCSRSGYVLSSWNEKADGSGKTFYLNNAITNNIIKNRAPNFTLYAQWSSVPCGASNPLNCPIITACRDGATYVYNAATDYTGNGSNGAGVVYHTYGNLDANTFLSIIGDGYKGSVHLYQVVLVSGATNGQNGTGGYIESPVYNVGTPAYLWSKSADGTYYIGAHCVNTEPGNSSNYYNAICPATQCPG